MDDETWRRRVDEDMARVPSMQFSEAMAFLSSYSTRTFGDEILRGELTVEQVRGHADRALARVWQEHDEAAGA